MKVIVIEHKPKGLSRWIFLGARKTWKDAQLKAEQHRHANTDICQVRLRKFIPA